MKDFKIRCSSIGDIMTEPKENSPYKKWTDKVEQLKKAQSDYDGAANKETKTAKKLEQNVIQYTAELPELDRHKNDLHLSKTCIAVIDQWIKEQPEFYGRQKEFTSKYTDKGIECEDAAIDFVAQQYSWGKTGKNLLRFEQDEHIEGTPDIIRAKSIEDIKCPWWCFTFPIFEKDMPNTDYQWQGNGYMAIVKRPEFGLHYVLMDAPERFIDMQARKEATRLGMEEVEYELFEEVKAKMTYSHLPAKLRLKSYYFSQNIVAELAIRERVEQIRKYIKLLNLEQYI